MPFKKRGRGRPEGPVNPFATLAQTVPLHSWRHRLPSTNEKLDDAVVQALVMPETSRTMARA
jgi:hypothetical protein